MHLSALGNDAGVSHTTARAWLSILEASYVVFRLPPHFNNLSKRLVKTPKLYFYDVGLASYLLGISRPEHVDAHPLRGALFENFVMSELLKTRYNSVRERNLYFFRDSTGNEVDVLLDFGISVRPVEIKAGKTANDDYFKGLRYYRTLNPRASRGVVVYGGERRLSFADGDVVPYTELAALQAQDDSLELG